METAALDVWQHVSWILSQLWDLNGDGVGLNYHDGCFVRTFLTTNRRKRKIHGSQKDCWLTRTETISRFRLRILP